MSVDKDLVKKEFQPPEKKVLLYSGGMDSWLIKEIWKPDILLYVDMGIDYQRQELEIIKKENDSRLKIVSLNLSEYEDTETKFVPARNLFLFTLASIYGNHICLGALQDDGIPDKTMKFLKSVEDTLAITYSGRLDSTEEGLVPANIKIEKKFKQMQKPELLREYVAQGGDLDKAWNYSFSCYAPVLMTDGDVEICGECEPCYKKFYSFYLAGKRNFNKTFKERAILRLEAEYNKQREHIRKKYIDECYKLIQEEKLNGSRN